MAGQKHTPSSPKARPSLFQLCRRGDRYAQRAKTKLLDHPTFKNNPALQEAMYAAFSPFLIQCNHDMAEATLNLKAKKNYYIQGANIAFAVAFAGGAQAHPLLPLADGAHTIDRMFASVEEAAAHALATFHPSGGQRTHVTPVIPAAVHGSVTANKPALVQAAATSVVPASSFSLPTPVPELAVQQSIPTQGHGLLVHPKDDYYSGKPAPGATASGRANARRYA